MESKKKKVVDPMVEYAYESLTKIQKRRVEVEANILGESKNDYLEELMMDFTNSFMLAGNVLKDGLLKDISRADLAKIMLYFGIGVYKRRCDEIVLISGGNTQKLEKEKNLLKEKYQDRLVEIYDKVWRYFESNKSIYEYYGKLSKSQKDLLTKLSRENGLTEIDYLNSLLYDKEKATILAKKILELKPEGFRIHQDDLKYALLYYGIGVNSHTPEEVFILSKYPDAIPLNSFVNTAKDIIVNSAGEIFNVHDEAMRIIELDNKEVEKGFSLR